MHCMRRGSHPPYPPFARGGKGRHEIGMKAQLVQDQLFITPDVPCYIASKRVLSEGGYEADQSMVFYGRPARLAPEAEDLIVRTVH